MNQKCLIWFAVLLAIVQIGHGLRQVVRDPPNEHPSHRGKCWLSSANRELSVGEIYTDRVTCQHIKCGADFAVTRTSCDDRRPQDGCVRTSIDQSKDYPDCCPQIKCGAVKIDY